MRLLVAVLVLAGAVWLLGKPWSQAVGSQKPPPKSRFLTTLKNETVTESSGVAVSLIRKGVYWTHNDSNGKAELFAFDEQGKDLGVYTLQGVDSRDWEDMASRDIAGEPFLYVGDIGDNLQNQEQVRVYRIPEPNPSDAKAIKKFDKYTVSYPDGPQNAETLMVAPTGDIYIVTKQSIGKSGLYKLANPKSAGTYELERVGTIVIEGGNSYSLQVTGGDISPDGKRVVLRTYFSVLLFNVESISDVANKKPVSLPVPLERQGEAVCFDVSNDRLITTSEGTPCRVSTITLP